MPRDLGTWGFILSVAALILMYPVGLLVNWSSPKIQDWWASWSQRRLQKKIQGLERELRTPLSGEEVIIYGVKGLFQFLLLLFIFSQSWSMPADFHFPKMLSLQAVNLRSSINETELVAWIRVAIWAITYFTGLWFFVRVSVKHTYSKNPDLYQDKMKERIAKLHAHLK